MSRLAIRILQAPRWKPKRPINYGKVVAATIRETSRPEFERRIGIWRETVAIHRDYETWKLGR